MQNAINSKKLGHRGSLSSKRLSQNYTHHIMAEAESSDTAESNPLPVISPQFCSPHSVSLKIAKKFLALAGDFVATNINSNETLFKVNCCFFTIRERRVLQDAAGKPIVTLYKKIMTMHERWRVFKGDSTDSNDLIFSVKRSTMIQLGIIKLEVFLAENQTEEDCDFKIHVKFLKRSCLVYAGQSSKIIAEMEKNFGGAYKVTVHPNIDSAFIATLILILHEIGHVDRWTNSAIKNGRRILDPFDSTGFFFNGAAFAFS